MNIYLSLLRGINVSGQKKIAMQDLLRIYLNLGLINPVNYIQTGNIVFHSSIQNKKELEVLISEKIQLNYGFHVPVQVWERSEMENIYRNNPFLSLDDVDFKFLHLTLLSELPQNNLSKRILKNDYSPEKFKITERAIYLYCPQGYGRTKLNNNFFESQLKTSATTRNWKTIGKLIEILNKTV